MFGQAFSNLTPLDTKDILDAPGLLQTPSRGEYLGTHLSSGFDRSSTGRILEETDIQRAEDEENTADLEYRQAAMDLAGQGMSPEDVGLKHSMAMTEEDWKASPYYREKIQYRPDMTETRARIMAENYDERRHQELIISAGDESYGLAMKALGFGAMMLGTLPDPINFVPFTAGLNAAKIGAQAGITAAIKAGAKAGAINGMAGNALVDAIAIPDLRARGEDLGLTDFLLDTAFGAVLGTGLGGLGGGLSGYMGARRKAWIDRQFSNWQTSERAAETSELRSQHADLLKKTYLEDHPEANAAEVEEWAKANALLFDFRAHSWAERDMGNSVSVRDYYDAWLPEWRSQYGREAQIRQEFGSVDNDFLANAAPDEFPEGITEKPAVQAEPELDVQPLSPEDRGPIFKEESRPGIQGNESTLATSQGDEPIRYEVRELDDLVPSHDVHDQFHRRAEYPADVQERPYHSDMAEQDKVRRNALALDPRYLVNDNPDASTGPPVVSKSGIVLGGNSRTMSMQLARDSERFGLYRDTLMQNAERFGLDPEQIKGMRHPVLVRAIDKDMSLKEMAQASRRYNETTTQSLQTEAEGVSKAKLIRQNTLDHLNEKLTEGDFGTLRDFLNSSSSKDFVQMLVRDGVIEQTQASRMIDQDGFLKSEGKSLVENSLRGIVIPSYDIIRDASASVIGKIDRALPYLAQLKAMGGPWDLSKPLIDALGILRAAREGKKGAATAKDVWTYLHQGSLVGGKKHTQASQILAMSLADATQKELTARIAQMVEYAKTFKSLNDTGGGLLGASAPKMTPADAFINSFLRPVVTRDGAVLHGFDPAKNIDHRAIRYMESQGGMEKALEQLQATMKDEGLSPDQRSQAKELFGAVGRMGGSKYQIFEPKIEGAAINTENTFFQPGNKDSSPRGHTTFQDDGKAVVDFFKSSDFTTAPHEIYHVFRRELEATAKDARSSLEAKQRWKDICKFVGAEEGATWTKAQEEMFVEAGERYLATGEAPRPELQGVFDKLKDWFIRVYQAVTNAGIEVSPRMKEIFDGMLSVDSFPRNESADIARAGVVGRARRDVLRAQEKALGDFANGRSVDVEQVLRESEAMGKAYDAVKGDELGGPPDEILAVISSPEFERILVERGPAIAKEDGGFTVKDKEFTKQFGTRGWGLVKIIWRHGEKSGQEYKVKKDDLIKLPFILREYEPISKGEFGTSKKENRWTVADEGGVYTVYTIRRRRKGYKEPTLITVFKTKDSGYGLSKKRDLLASSAGENPHNGGKSPNYRDTTEGGLPHSPQRQEGLAAQDGSSRTSFDLNISPESAEVNYRTEQEPKFPEAPKLTTDPESIAKADEKSEQTLHEEIADGIERARQEGLLTEEQQRELLLNKQQTERAAQYDELGQTAVECAWNAVE